MFIKLVQKFNKVPQQYIKHSNFFGSCNIDSLHIYPKDVQEKVLKKMQTHISQPTLRPTKEREKYSEEYDRTPHCNGCQKCNNWERDIPLMTIQEALREAIRCLKCNDAPCQKGCTTSIDIKTFIYNIQNKNWYGAAKCILSDNPLGLTCGQLCPISELCARNCNVSHTEQGAIKINRLQELAVRIFKEMGVKQIKDPSLVNLPPSYKTPIALIGAGPASLSCATFLGRMGYENINIFERESRGGGITSNEIPQNRAPIEEALWEIQMVEQLGVKFHYNKALGKDFSLEDLRNQGFETIFLGIGLTEPNTGTKGASKEFALSAERARQANNFHYSKHFLLKVGEVIKQTKPKAVIDLPKMDGHVVVLGIGDTALDCARSAFRLGAKRVTVVFRRGFQDMRANDEIFEPGRQEGINFVAYSSPLEYEFNEKGNVKAVKFDKYLPQNNDPDNLKYKQTDQNYSLPCDHIVQSFGCQLPDQDWVKKIKKSDSLIDVDYSTNKTKAYDWLFVGGDAIGTKNLVDAVNDGKTASWFMHKYIQEKAGYQVPTEPILPGFYTEIDLVDISTEVCGVKMNNPFGLASAPPTTSYPMISRSFDIGYDFAVIKTLVLDKDTVSNISPRIYKLTSDPLKLEPSFGNIELVSEKSLEYWVKGAIQIKKDYPNKILIGSLMAGNNEQDWYDIVEKTKEAPFDMIELNLSCPHGMNEKGMGRACGEDPDVVRQITKWVTSKTKVPIIIKITPNYGQAELLAQAAYEGGAKAVTLTNTMPGLIDPYPDGEFSNGVGVKKQVTPGGSTGSILRPFALRKCVDVAKYVPQIEIFGSGGIISGDHALSYIQYGAKALQICSAVQNLDAATVFYDLKTSLQANLYLLGDEKARQKGWKGQYPPYGFQKMNNEPNSSKFVKPPKILQLVASKLNNVSPIEKMSRNIIEVPEINKDHCLECGRCYVSCTDSGYQAIQFDGFNTIPRIIEDDCTGCAVCVSSCPVENAIKMVPRKTPYTVNRGIPPGNDCPEIHLNTVPPFKP
ncbi:hypothetical protein IMG5_196150 [Ichthyophthirius multifiliis]|uniref:dihydropyrimidine dehydrogenase (NADP(+)) n=1 Tax=Ichthyophthirius multifiliis TaxID=5932 RepID=G0R530_ICHMU|nr:hypothetical protein IMG5_196150 [Ichthyophthirius multifiliis]EGR27432.1 hypothetical protein IMG5_196150 [Ichthyophthirius multifiliis]|eukprot:XP_004024342.1 hypothetical protein IMG5_196150 [Ichthyophthirius multifiliis]